MATWDDLRAVAATLPETVETAPHEWRVRAKNLAWERPLRKADLEALGADAPQGDILGVRVADVGVAEALVADDPAVYFRTPHFAGYPAVLVRLEVIEPAELHGLVRDAWLARAPKRTARAYLDANP
ncbi:MAG: hypothetical protein QOH97_3733 [Actinoplanes sp.]|jgi:hypothetical protein|nr:hypothetical protein [Actinoplanes sp.]